MSGRELSATPSLAFWVALALYLIATIGLLTGFLRARPELSRQARLVAIAAFVCHGIDIGWRGVLSVHPAASVREALGVSGEIDVVQAAKTAAEAELAGNGRVLLRPSGTEQLVRVMVEAGTADAALDTAQRIADVVAAAGA